MHKQEGTQPPENCDAYPEKPSAGDYGHLAIRAAISAIPSIGGPALEIFNVYVAPPLTRRRDEFIVRLDQRLRNVQGDMEELQPDRLAQNPAFTSALLTSVMIALRTHQEEKLEALAWATVNSALQLDIEGTREFMFLHWIDEFTPHHLRILRILENPRRLLEEAGQPIPSDGASPTMRDVFGFFVPELDADEGLLNQIIEDLKTRGLVDPMKFGRGTNISAFPLSNAPFASDLGRRFLRFIEKPQGTTAEKEVAKQ